jgi:hypothetical protein
MSHHTLCAFFTPKPMAKKNQTKEIAPKDEAPAILETSPEAEPAEEFDPAQAKAGLLDEAVDPTEALDEEEEDDELDGMRVEGDEEADPFEEELVSDERDNW